VLPRLPLWAKTPGTRNEDLFQGEFNALRAKFPQMTKPEGRVYLWLQKHFKDSGGNHEWTYIYPLVTYYRQGGIEVDFAIFGPRLAWQVQGEHFHFGDPTVEAQDLVERTVISSSGWTVINLLESMINEDVDRVCREALLGNQLYDDSITSSGFSPFAGNPAANRARIR
jgi:hypothetical protein